MDSYSFSSQSLLGPALFLFHYAYRKTFPFAVNVYWMTSCLYFHRIDRAGMNNQSNVKLRT